MLVFQGVCVPLKVPPKKPKAMFPEKSIERMNCLMKAMGVKEIFLEEKKDTHTHTHTGNNMSSNHFGPTGCS